MVRDEKLARRLVVRRGTSGNCTYDEGAKRELIELCQIGTVSVAKVALTYGINPNLLHNWIALHRKEGMGKLPAPSRETSACAPTSFIPVVTTPIPQPAGPITSRLKPIWGIKIWQTILERFEERAPASVMARMALEQATTGAVD